MSENLGRKNLPNGHSPEDFQCFGPPAIKDGDFAGTKICDMGCFQQGETDSNKYYHGAVVKSKKDNNWFAYFEWGRVGNQKNDFQFIACEDESEAQDEYESQLHSKNDKRGQWTTIAGIKTLGPKPGKDCYLVRPQAKRATGLPDGKTITSNEGAKQISAPAVSKTAAIKPKADPQTLALMRDLNVATVAYTRGSMAGGSIPTQGAIDDGRQILTEAQKRVLHVGDNVNDQIKDKDLVQFSSLLYSKIPKTKRVGAPPDEWILSSGNINQWQKDLDAFESALYTAEHSVQQESDPFNGMPLDMSWIDPKSSIGSWIYRWTPKATRGRHGYGKMTVHNAWKVARHGDETRLFKCQDEIAANRSKEWVRETALHQEEPPAMSSVRSKVYRDSHSTMLFHGTRSVNVSGILRKALLLPSQLVGVVITGAMFGPGLYFADDWMKSAGYTSLKGSYWSGGGGQVSGRNAFMFITEVALGNPFVAPGPKGYTSAPQGHHCVFGKAGQSSVQNNEWIVFKAEQHMLRYLIEFSA
jgi:hypothetical protein